MPNWCTNFCSIKCESMEEFKWLNSMLDSEEPFQRILPLEERTADNQTKKWGTKWEPDSLELSTFEKDLAIDAYFLTAWTPPIGIYKELTEKGFEVEARWAESGCGFSGIYVRGELEEGFYGEYYDEPGCCDLCRNIGCECTPAEIAVMGYDTTDEEEILGNEEGEVALPRRAMWPFFLATSLGSMGICTLTLESWLVRMPTKSLASRTKTPKV